MNGIALDSEYSMVEVKEFQLKSRPKNAVPEGTVVTLEFKNPTPAQVEKYADKTFAIIKNHTAASCSGNYCPLHYLKLPYMAQLDYGMDWFSFSEKTK